LLQIPPPLLNARDGKFPNSDIIAADAIAELEAVVDALREIVALVEKEGSVAK
jgi:hypothetical protein